MDYALLGIVILIIVVFIAIVRRKNNKIDYLIDHSNEKRNFESWFVSQEVVDKVLAGLAREIEDARKSENLESVLEGKEGEHLEDSLSELMGQIAKRKDSFIRARISAKKFNYQVRDSHTDYLSKETREPQMVGIRKSN